MIQPIEINLSEIVDGLAEGEYKCNVVDCEMKTSKSGNPYLRWQLTAFDCPDTRFNNQSVWHSTPTTGKGAFRLMQLFKAATGAKLDARVTSLDPQQILGKQLWVTVVKSLDQNGGETGFMEVKSVRALN